MRKIPPNASSEEESQVLPEQEETFIKEEIGLTGEDETLLKTEAETNPISEETEAPPRTEEGNALILPVRTSDPETNKIPETSDAHISAEAKTGETEDNELRITESTEQLALPQETLKQTSEKDDTTSVSGSVFALKEDISDISTESEIREPEKYHSEIIEEPDGELVQFNERFRTYKIGEGQYTTI
ncbi:MAG: hypothetical protein PUA70_06155, partial [Oribacterium sp.]|nr:hypothetical protein [Oribacterium sp.]